MHPVIASIINDTLRQTAEIEAQAEALGQVVTALSVRCRGARLMVTTCAWASGDPSPSSSFIAAECNTGEDLGETEAALAMLGLRLRTDGGTHRHYSEIPGTACSVLLNVAPAKATDEHEEFLADQFHGEETVAANGGLPS